MIYISILGISFAVGIFVPFILYHFMRKKNPLPKGQKMQILNKEVNNMKYETVTYPHVTLTKEVDYDYFAVPGDLPFPTEQYEGRIH